MSKVLHFKDFGFKLAVIDHLMYKNDIIKPALRAEGYLEKVRGLAEGEGYDLIEEAGYDEDGAPAAIPEVKAYFEQLEITEDMVQGITALQSDGGDEIYLEITPFWDGEDDAFDVRSADDVQLLPNLKEAILLFEYPGEQLIQAFQAFGVTLESI